MDRFLRALGLKGNVAIYIKCFGSSGIFSVNDLISEKPSMQQLLGMGIDHLGDIKMIYEAIELECEKNNEDDDTGYSSTNYYSSGLSSSYTPDSYSTQYKYKDFTDSTSIGEDQLDQLRREYELVMGKTNATIEEESEDSDTPESSPSNSRPISEDYSPHKNDYDDYDSYDAISKSSYSNVSESPPSRLKSKLSLNLQQSDNSEDNSLSALALSPRHAPINRRTIRQNRGSIPVNAMPPTSSSDNLNRSSLDSLEEAVLFGDWGIPNDLREPMLDQIKIIRQSQMIPSKSLGTIRDQEEGEEDIEEDYLDNPEEEERQKIEMLYKEYKAAGSGEEGKKKKRETLYAIARLTENEDIFEMEETELDSLMNEVLKVDVKTPKSSTTIQYPKNINNTIHVSKNVYNIKLASSSNELQNRLARGFSIGSRAAVKPTLGLTRSQFVPQTARGNLQSHPVQSKEELMAEELPVKVVPLNGIGIEGVELVKRDPVMAAQIEALKELAKVQLRSGGTQFGNELKLEVLDPVQVGSGKAQRTVYLVQLSTNMRQFSHLTYHRLHVRRTYSHFSDLFTKIVACSNCNFPLFPKKDFLNRFSRTVIHERLEYFNMLLSEIAKDPGLNSLQCVIDFFDDSKVLSVKKDSFAPPPRPDDKSKRTTTNGSNSKKKNILKASRKKKEKH
jgi:hypothetical protein